MVAIAARVFSEVLGILKRPSGATRSSVRYHRIALSAVAGIVQKCITVGTSLISVPLALRYLGTEQFGIWMAFMGFVSFLQFTDFGLGLGLQNHLTACDGADNRTDPKRLVSSTLAVFIPAAVLLVLAAVFAIPSLPVQGLVRTNTDAARAQLLPCARMFVIAFAVILPVGSVQYVCNAYQRSYLTNGILAAANLIALTGIVIGIGAHLPLWWFIFVTTFAPAPLYLVVGTTILWSRKWLRPTFSAVSLGEVRRVVSLGLPAFGAQVGATLSLQGPLVVISSVLGAAALIPFALSQQLLSVANQLLNVMVMPLWPAYGEAAARGDAAWIKRTFSKSLLVSLVVTGPTFVIVALLGRAVIRFWTGRPDVVPTIALLMACNAWAIVWAWNRACSMLLNGLGSMAGQALYGIMLPVITLALSFQVGRTVGVVGVIWIAVFGDTLRAAFLGGEVLVMMRVLKRLGRGGAGQVPRLSRWDYLSTFTVLARRSRSLLKRVSPIKLFGAVAAKPQ